MLFGLHFNNLFFHFAEEGQLLLRGDVFLGGGVGNIFILMFNSGNFFILILIEHGIFLIPFGSQ